MDLLALRTAILAAACAAAPLLAGAAPSAEEDTRQVRDVISTQFQAFAEDDADKAFDTATPGVRKAMGHPSHFLAMVRGTYPMVYRPASVTFLDTELKGRLAWQLMRVLDHRGKNWMVMFLLERQGDGSWRVAGCTVGELRGQPA